MKLFSCAYKAMLCALLLITPCVHLSAKTANLNYIRQKGDNYYASEQLTEAMDCYIYGLDLAEESGNERDKAIFLGRLGNIYGIVGDYQRCLNYQLKAYRGAVKLGDEKLQYPLACNLVQAYCHLEDVAGARRYLNAMQLLPWDNVTEKRSDNLFYNGLIATLEKRYQIAEYYFNKALRYAEEKEYAPQYSEEVYIQLGKLYCMQNLFPKAHAFYDKASAFAVRYNDMNELADIHRHKSIAYCRAGDSINARKQKLMALSISDSVFSYHKYYMVNNKLLKCERKSQDKAISRLQIFNHHLMLMIALISCCVILLSTLYYMLRRKSRKLLQAQQMLVKKNEELIVRSKALCDKMQLSISAADDAKQQERLGIGLSDEQIDELKRRIIRVMDDVDYISRPDFSLGMLSQAVESNTKYVSWIINDVLGKNFKSMLNEARIMEACKRLSDTDNYGNMTIQAIYQDLGYSSAASFISAFKKENGMTPSVYQRLVRSRK